VVSYYYRVSYSSKANSKKTGFSRANILSILIYIFINCLFTYKYAFDYSVNPAFVSILYAALFIIFYLIITGKIGQKIFNAIRIRLYWPVMALAAVCLLVIMLQFNPDEIAVGRYPALHDWIDRLLHGMFPYQSPTNPSGLPMLFILATPFYLLGDLGLFQIFSFIIFCFAAGYIFNGYSNKRLIYPALLLCAPIFLYEIVVRSELISNITLVILFLAVTEKYADHASKRTLIILGLIGGLLLSTRVVVFLLYLVFWSNRLRNWRHRYIWFIISAVIGFAATLLPFMIWNYDYFVNRGPFAVQALYAPIWLVMAVVVISLLCGLMLRSQESKFKASAYIMFGLVLIAFIFGISEHGWMRAVVGDQFDISYFCFCLPFLILGFDFPENRKTEP